MMSIREMLWAKKQREEPVEDPAPPVTRFACRTCGTSGPFYVAREVTNWNKIGDPWKMADGSLTYHIYNVFLPGEPGPERAYFCSNCRTSENELNDLVEARQ